MRFGNLKLGKPPVHNTFTRLFYPKTIFLLVGTHNKICVHLGTEVTKISNSLHHFLSGNLELCYDICDEIVKTIPAKNFSSAHTLVLTRYLQTLFQLFLYGWHNFFQKKRKHHLMKGLIIIVLLVCITGSAMAQETIHKDNINSRTSWLKTGLSPSIPVGNTSKASSFALGADLSGQMMASPNWGLGIATGYTHYFGKNGVSDFGAIPLGALIRYYPSQPGLLVGTDVGYSFTTNIPNSSGGFYVKPQLGWQNYDWNIYGFYNHVFDNKGIGDLQNLGVAFTYNIRFN